MIKKSFYYFGIILLIIFSFYYTNIASLIIREKDPIMITIKNNEEKYKIDFVNATIDGDYIIPGLNGLQINIDKSYKTMKKYGSYLDTLIIYKQVMPEVSINKIFNKYISRGNKNNKNVGLVFIVDNYSYVEEIINILVSKNVKATFFIKDNIIEESTDLIKYINSSGSEIELYSLNIDNNLIKKTNKILKKEINSKISFCYLDKEDYNVLNICKDNYLHTIIPSINTKAFPFNDIKMNLDSGSIIKLDCSKETLRELSYIINYINQRGYKMVSLKELIRE